MGRIAKLAKTVTIKDAVEKMKQHLSLSHIRLALSNIHTKGSSCIPIISFHLFFAFSDSKISSIAVCAGSGASLLLNVTADLFITGEMSHHEILDAVHKGTTVILCEHSNTERAYQQLLTPILEEYLKLNVIISELDSDPIKII